MRGATEAPRSCYYAGLMNNANVLAAPGFARARALYFAAFLGSHKTSDLNGIRSPAVAPRRQEYKWRAPGVKNPSKNVARRVKDICFAVERLGRALPRGNHLLLSLYPSFSLVPFYFFASVYKSGTNRRRSGTSQRDRSLSNRETFLFADRPPRAGNDAGEIVKGNESSGIKRAGKMLYCSANSPSSVK